MTIQANERTATSTSFPQVCRDHTGTYDYGWVAQLPVGSLTPNVFLFRQDVASKTTQTFDLSTIVNNPFNMPLQGDGHFTMCVISDAAGLVHVWGNLHADPLDGPGTQRHYGYTTWPPNTSSSWTFPAWSSLPYSTLSSNAHTYFQATRNPAGDLLLFNDQEDQVNNYHRFWSLLKLPAGSTTWQYVDPANPKLTSGVPGNTGGTAVPNTANRVYSKATLVGTRMHITSMFADVMEATSGFWRQEHTYMWADPPYTTWRAADGTPITLPLTWGNRTAALISTRPDRSTEMAPQVAVDEQDRPYVTYNHVDASGAQINADLWYQVYWNGTAWAVNHINSGTNPPGAGPSYPGCVWWGGQLWTQHNLTAANGDKVTGRFRLRNAANQIVNVGGDAAGHMTPYPDPIAVRDRARPRFLVPDGNNPMVYEFMPPLAGRFS